MATRHSMHRRRLHVSGAHLALMTRPQFGGAAPWLLIALSARGACAAVHALLIAAQVDRGTRRLWDAPPWRLLRTGLSRPKNGVSLALNLKRDAQVCAETAHQRSCTWK